MKHFNASHDLVLRTSRLTIKALDLENLYHYAHHYEVVHQNLEATCILDTHDPDIAYAFEKAYYEATNDPDRYFWFTSWELILTAESEIVGGLCFKGPPDENGLVEVGYGIYETHRGKGYATEGLEALIKWAFSNQKVNAIIASIQPSNAASRNVLKKLGFSQGHDEEGLQWWHKRK